MLPCTLCRIEACPSTDAFEHHRYHVDDVRGKAAQRSQDVALALWRRGQGPNPSDFALIMIGAQVG